METDFDFFKIHIRGMRNKNPLPYTPLTKVKSGEHPVLFRNHEAVFKIVSFIKNSVQAKNCMTYLAMKSEGLTEEKPLYDSMDNSFTHEQFDKKIDELNLQPKIKNERLMVHFIVSFPKEHELKNDDLSPFIQRYMEPFTREGYDFIYTVHSHQAHQHFHVLLKMNNGRKRLQFRKRDCAMMRQRQVEIAKEFGITLSASRCIDREFTLTQAPIFPVKKPLLERQVPLYAQRRKKEGRYFTTRKYPIEEHEALNDWSASFENQNRAKQLFLEMYTEKPKTAFWYANHQPKVFGEVETPPPPINELNFELNENEKQKIINYCVQSHEQSLGMSL